jgi:hypothetical protein
MLAKKIFSSFRRPGIVIAMAVRHCDYCGGELTVVNTQERVRRPFTPESLGIVMRERVCRGGTFGREGCGMRTFTEEHVVSAVPSVNQTTETS